MKFSVLRKGITLLLFVLTCCISNVMKGQITGWVYFKDKGAEAFNPNNYFTFESINRRVQLGIAFNEKDHPVALEYLKKIAIHTDSIHGTSKWLNGAVITCSTQSWNRISELDFVSNIDTTAYSSIQTVLCSAEINNDTLSQEQKTSIQLSIENMEGQLFQKANISGNNIIIAILDAGFKGVQVGNAFSHIRNQNRIIATRDFIQPRSKSIYAFSTHGAKVLSCIGGKVDSVSMGLATNAKFILARVTPQFGAFRTLNDIQWIQALEWADEQGASIVNSSLSFTTQLFSRKEMDGISARISKVANTAAEKGIVIVNSAGNEFDSAWEIIGAPADASDILSIGSISPITFLHSDFSSIGPTADGRMKPDLCAVGELYVAHEKMEYVQGTSFAAPLVTGFVACIQEMHPTWNAYEVMEKMRKSGHLFPYFDYAHGFGVPQARFFMNMEMPDTTLDFLKTSFSHCEFYRKDSLFFELSFCFKNDSLINEQLKNLGFGINNSMKEQTNAFISVLNENGELKSFGFNRVQTEYRFGDASYASPDDAPSEFEYFFGLPDLTIPSCPNCTIRVHFLDQIINLPLANE